MTLLRQLRALLRLRPRQVFEVPQLPDPEPLTAEQWDALQDYDTATYPAYRHTQLAQLATTLEDTNA